LTAVPAATILSAPMVDLEVRTDGEAGDEMRVDLHNVGTTNIGHVFPGEGNASVITPGGFERVSAPGAYAATGSDAKSLDAVVLKGSDLVWIECLFPLDEVLCRVTPYP
jgi:hypothetical protein